MVLKQIGLKLDVELLGRVDSEIKARGCSRKDAIEAGLLLWLGDGLAEGAVAVSSSAARVERVRSQVPAVRPAASFVRPAHAQTCKCPVCVTG